MSGAFGTKGPCQAPAVRSVRSVFNPPTAPVRPARLPGSPAHGNVAVMPTRTARIPHLITAVASAAIIIGVTVAGSPYVGASVDDEMPTTVRFATFNASLNREQPGELIDDLAAGTFPFPTSDHRLVSADVDTTGMPDPEIPEAPMVVLFALTAIVVGGGWVVVDRRRAAIA